MLLRNHKNINFSVLKMSGGGNKGKTKNKNQVTAQHWRLLKCLLTGNLPRSMLTVCHYYGMEQDVPQHYTFL